MFVDGFLASKMKCLSCRTAGMPIMTIVTLEILCGGDWCARKLCLCVRRYTGTYHKDAGPLGHIIKMPDHWDIS